jgi:hypothetical protein
LSIGAIFCLGYRSLLHCVTGGAHGIMGFEVGYLYADYTAYAVLMDSSSNFGSIDFIYHNGQTSGSIASGPVNNSVAFLINGNSNSITISKFNTIGCANQAINMVGNSNRMTVTDINFKWYNWCNNNFPAIQFANVTPPNYMTVLNSPSYTPYASPPYLTICGSGGINAPILALDSGGCVDTISVTPAVSGGTVSINAIGSDSNIPLNIIAKGNSPVNISDTSNGIIGHFYSTAGANVYLTLANAVSPNGAVISCAGQTNANVFLQGFGTGGAVLGNTGGNIGFFGSSVAAKPTVTGLKGGNAALGSLLSALASLGLITDSSGA